MDVPVRENLDAAGPIEEHDFRVSGPDDGDLVAYGKISVGPEPVVALPPVLAELCRILGDGGGQAAR